jgi:hypothetical protein
MHAARVVREERLVCGFYGEVGAELYGPVAVLSCTGPSLRSEFVTFSKLPDIDAANNAVTTTKSSKIQKSHKLLIA